MASLPKSALVINGGAGVIETLVSAGDRGALCSDFLLKAKVRPGRAVPPDSTSARQLGSCSGRACHPVR